MKRLFLLICILAYFMPVGAQQHHYLFLQSEERQSFYIRYDGRIMVSGTAGYIILAKLKEAQVKFGLGFSAGNQAEINFELNTNRQDKGYLVKHFGEKGWGLFDLQTAEVVYAATPESKAATSSTVLNEYSSAVVTNDPFAEMLSQVTKDSTVKQVSVVKPVAPKPTVSTEAPSVTVTRVVITEDEPEPKVDMPKKTEPAPAAPVTVQAPVWQAPVKSVPVILSVVQSSEGIDLVVTDKADEQIDTITIFIPRAKQHTTRDSMVNEATSVDSVQGMQQTNLVADTNSVLTDTLSTKSSDTAVVSAAELKLQPQTPVEVLPAKDTLVQIITEQKVDSTSNIKAPSADSIVAVVSKMDTISAVITNTADSSALIISKGDTAAVKTVVADSSDTVRSVAQPLRNTPTTVASSPNPKCNATATNDEFIQLRKRMILAKNEAMMVEAARKGFAAKCYTVTQLELLSLLFLSDEWRYRFYDAAYQSVSDFAGFESLEKNITDPYYRKRFRALLPDQ